MYLQQLGSALMGMVVRHDFRSQVPWEEYLQALRGEDGRNVAGFAQRLERLSKERNLPLAIVAVGSVLNPSESGRGQYSDIDLLLVPLLRSDLHRFYSVVAEFMAAQPETAKKTAGTGRLLMLGKLRAAAADRAPNADEKLKHLMHWYAVSTYWRMDFRGASPIEVFVRKLEHRRTLADMAAYEDSQPIPQKFSRLVFA